MKTFYAGHISHIPSQAELDDAVRLGRRLHSDAMRSFFTGTAGVIATPFQRLAQRRMRRRTAKSLNALSDRMLSDIGVERSEIWAIAARPSEYIADSSPIVTATVSTLPVNPARMIETQRKLAA